MKFNIYNYADQPVEIETQNKPIEEIFVQILSGDETIIVAYADNDEDEFDSSMTALHLITMVFMS